MVERKGNPIGLVLPANKVSSVFRKSNNSSKGNLWESMIPFAPVPIKFKKDGLDEEVLIQGLNDLLTKGIRRFVIALAEEEQEKAVKKLLINRYPGHLLGSVPISLFLWPQQY